MSEELKCGLAKPSYDELYKEVDRLERELNYKTELIKALEVALSREHISNEQLVNDRDCWQFEHHKESKRANELLEKLDKLEKR